MKINVLLILVLFVFISCGTPPASTRASYLHRMIDTLPAGHTGNTLVYTINPNDCISCLDGFRIFDKELSAQATIYIISISREIEKQEWLQKMPYPDLRPRKNKMVVWGKEHCDIVGNQARIPAQLTSLIIYNYEKDSVVFAQPVRELNDISKIQRMLDAN